MTDSQPVLDSVQLTWSYQWEEKVNGWRPRQRESTACILCSEPVYAEAGVSACLFLHNVDDGNKQSDRQFYFKPICRICLAAGPEGAAQRLERRASQLIAAADRIRKIPSGRWVSTVEMDQRVLRGRAWLRRRTKNTMP